MAKTAVRTLCQQCRRRVEQFFEATPMKGMAAPGRCALCNEFKPVVRDCMVRAEIKRTKEG